MGTLDMLEALRRGGYDVSLAANAGGATWTLVVTPRVAAAGVEPLDFVYVGSLGYIVERAFAGNAPDGTRPRRSS